MSVPSLPPFYDMPYTDMDGYLTGDAQLYNDQMFQSLDIVVEFFNEGLQVPQKTTAEITAYGADSSVPLGTIWYDTNINKLKVKTGASTIETITSV